jgi:O-antigen/teichoic acid export membrane protein
LSNPLKRLVGQTAIYGMPTIVGRLLNYLLVPLYTYIFGKNADAYGAVSELYAWVAFLMILLTFGMETTFFRFFNERDDKDKVLQNSFLTVIGINGLFLLVLLLLHQSIADAMLFGGNPEYIVLLGLIVFMDAVTAVPMAKLRAEQKAKKFALIHFTAIAVNILLNLLLLLLFYDKQHPESGVIIILIANLLSSSVKVIGTYRDFLNIQWTYDREMGKEMTKYAFPLVIAGFAGIVNETLDRALLKHVLYNRGGMSLKEAQTQLGIYSACYKLAMLATIFLQAYRYAAEPFFFAQNKNKDRNKIYIKVMNYFIASVCLIFLGVSLNIDIFKHFIQNEIYWEGLGVVPVLLVAGIFLGIYFNQSIWYKLSGQTRFGAYIALGGASLTILINLIFIPTYGYWASAWATLIVYAVQMIASYLLGQKHYPINYNLRKFGLYLGVALTFYFITYWVDLDPGEWTLRKFVFHNLLILFYVGIVWFIERPQVAQMRN